MNRFALTSLYRSLTRHKLYAALNIGGLALGIAVFLVLGLYVRFETSFEQWLPHHDELYVVQTKLQIPGSPFNGAYPVTMPGLFEEMRQDFPGLVGTRIRGGKQGGSVIRENDAIGADVAQVDPSFFDVFDIPMVRCDGRRALADPSGALLSRTEARRLFGDADPIGQNITISVDAPQVYRVAGIFEDLPTTTDLQANILIPMPRTPPPPVQWSWYKWGMVDGATYLRLPDAAAARTFEAKMPAFVRRHAGQDLGPDPAKVIALSLLPLTRLHLQPPGGVQSSGRTLTIVTLGLVGVLTLLIAIINYVNLATAQSGLRAREVAMRKVLGADRRMLIRQFLGEAAAMAAVASLLGMILAEVSLPLVNAAGGLSLNFPYALALPLLVALVLIIALTAGFYPAVLLSRFPAAAVLASARAPGGGRNGTRSRELLVVIQFGLAIAFMIGTVVLVAQTAHVRQSDLGFQREGLLVIPSLADKRIFPAQARPILDALRRLPGVVSVGSSSSAPGMVNSSIDVIERASGPGVTVSNIPVGPDFFRTYAPRLLAGRVFDDAHGADDSSDWTKWKNGRNVVVNRKAVEQLGFRAPEEAIGKTVGRSAPRTIIGVVDQLRFASPRTAETATLYQYSRDVPTSAIAAIRYTGDSAAMLARIRSTWQRLSPQVPLVVGTADQQLADFYKADEQAVHLFGIGAGLAVLIGCVGLWGLASFNTSRRVREIGIRKTLGASSAHIVRLLVGQFLRPVLIANFIAWPLAYAAMRTWLAGFDDRIALSPLFFAGATLLALTIAVLTVLGQALRASRATPAWALRHD
ncbi:MULTISPECIES: ABC transporter permease [unclassified Sphingomonas]|uniref:ABC transporter permease n=1 Tax=unclassified Sphingomonas TaxID=196159 RepID=UPI0006FC1FD6|nr:MULTISPECIES: ABC transporter permease [unclassified Sphingomonas]KQM61914.1 transporter [Sphingomonas sp. Leaf16]KQN13187.1 transporter [Sphingomonas sp. Leaf29]KQN20072.1 transporter [Sphingomonas sp. Leaf32]